MSIDVTAAGNVDANVNTTNINGAIGASAVSAAAPSHALFIDARVPELSLLVHGAADKQAVHVLSPKRDGVQQIAEILVANELNGLAAISIVAHGEPGTLAIGS